MSKEFIPFDHEAVEAKQEALRKRYSQETTTLYEGIEEKYHQAPAGGRPMHWFLLAYTPQGKRVTLGPFNSEEEVQWKITEEGLTEEIIRQYPTIQLSKATQLLKNEVTEQPPGKRRPIDAVLGRVKHQKSLTKDKTKKKRFKLF